jgi:hypothetical protein
MLFGESVTATLQHGSQAKNVFVVLVAKIQTSKRRRVRRCAGVSGSFRPREVGAYPTAKSRAVSQYGQSITSFFALSLAPPADDNSNTLHGLVARDIACDKPKHLWTPRIHPCRQKRLLRNVDDQSTVGSMASLYSATSINNIRAACATCRARKVRLLFD